jgi:hypothetical protein
MAPKAARMTPQTEGRIAHAVDDVIDRINDGEDPNGAIVKVAAEGQLPIGHVGLLISAYNTARTNRQRTAHDSLIEKSADFPVADPAVIIEQLLPTVVKSAAQIRREEDVSADYDRPPTWLERARARREFEKTAAAAPPLVASAPPPYPADPVVAMKRAYHVAERRERTVEEARRVCAAAQDGLIGCFVKLAAWFADPRNETIADVRDNVEARWGRQGAAILNHLAGTRPSLTKRANLSGPGVINAVHADREPYRTLIETIGRTEKVTQARAEFERAAADHAAKTAEELAPFVLARRESRLGLPSATVSAEKQAGPYASALGVQLTREMLGRVGQELEGPDRDKLVDKQLREISRPDHEQALRGIHTQAMLHGMLANDPIISGYHPEEVLAAFNQVSQLAPHAAAQPAVMGPLLRKWLQQGHIDTFEGDQLVGTEQKLKQIHAPAPQKESLLHGQRPTRVLA